MRCSLYLHTEAGPMHQKLFLILLLLLCFSDGYNQLVKTYGVVDAFVKSYPQKIENQARLDLFIRAINQKFPGDIDKVRGAFYWISENITYNYKAVNDNSIRQNDITKLIQSGQALCSGYSNLMEYFCRKFGIECVTINGTGRSLYSDIILNPNKLESDHSWNAIKINGEWKLIDATWGSGYTDYSTGEYHKSRNEKYFLAVPETFVYKHLPLNPQWQLLDTIVSAQTFCNWPFIDEGYFTNDISKVYPFQLFIDKKVGDTVQFKFTSAKELNYISFESLDNTVSEMGILNKSGNNYSYTFRPKKIGEFDIRVSVFNMGIRNGLGSVTFTPALIYRLRVKSK